MTTEVKPWYIYCDCHEGSQRELLAVLYGERLIIKKKKHEITIDVDRIKKMALIS